MTSPSLYPFHLLKNIYSLLRSYSFTFDFNVYAYRFMHVKFLVISNTPFVNIIYGKVIGSCVPNM
uniref:60S acidic ribosomal protein P1 isoform X4 n=1 Tax=Rhizophora mucronata TaxID=61149 RepID=A0A2P2J6S9_RHIMU